MSRPTDARSDRRSAPESSAAPQSPKDTPADPRLSRRRLFAGAGTAGALAAAAAVLPGAPEPQAVAVAKPRPAPEAGGGYQLSAHVQRYYQTTKI